MKDLYTVKYQSLMTATEEDPNKWKNNLCSWIERINIVKTTILPKEIQRFSAIPNKTSMTFFSQNQNK